MLKRAFRFIFALLGMLFGYGVSALIIENVPGLADYLGTAAYVAMVPICMGLFGIIFFYLSSGLFKRGEKATSQVITQLESVPITELAGGTVGLVCGLVIAYLISQIIYEIEVLQTAYINVIISVVLYVGLGYVGAMLAKRAVSSGKVFGPIAIQPRETAKKKVKKGLTPKILDTSVIIDGRIVDILRTGFMEGDIVIPDFVLVELRHIADSSDGLKRTRGRRGLDILARIQNEYGVDIYDTEADKALTAIPEVDVKLLKLAQKIKGFVVTNDFNLNKVAAVQGVPVLNINDLANALKPVVLPGEGLKVFLVKEGKENRQAIAYLDDGTMVVVEGGRNLIGQTIDTTVTSVLQTSAGRMIFAKPN